MSRFSSGYCRGAAGVVDVRGKPTEESSTSPTLERLESGQKRAGELPRTSGISAPGGSAMDVSSSIGGGVGWSFFGGRLDYDYTNGWRQAGARRGLKPSFHPFREPSSTYGAKLALRS